MFVDYETNKFLDKKKHPSQADNLEGTFRNFGQILYLDPTPILLFRFP